MKIIYSTLLMMIGFWSCLAQDSPPWRMTPGDDFHTNLFGVRFGTPICNGFLFINGRYIDAPYTFEERGTALFVNGEFVERVVFDSRLFPPAAVTNDPGHPKDLTAKSSLHDTLSHPLVMAKQQYYIATRQGEDIASSYFSFLASLPSISKIEPLPERELPEMAMRRVFDQQGQSIVTGCQKVKPSPSVPDREKILALTRSEREMMETRLNREALVFIGSPVLRICSVPMLGPNLEVLSILRSSMPLPEKIAQLQTIGFLSKSYHEGMIDDASYGPLLRNFSASPQLERRLKGEPVSLNRSVDDQTVPMVTPSPLQVVETSTEIAVPNARIPSNMMVSAATIHDHVSERPKPDGPPTRYLRMAILLIAGVICLVIAALWVRQRH